MSLDNLLVQTITQARRTARACSTAVFPFTANFVRLDTSAVRLKANGASLAGAVTLNITGELNGSPQTETLVVPAAAPSVAISAKRWTKVTQVASSTSTTGTLVVDVVDPNGQLVMQETTIASGIPCRLSRVTARVDSAAEGPQVIERWRAYVMQDVFTEEDLITIGTVQYQVQNINRLYDRTAQHHVELDLIRTS